MSTHYLGNTIDFHGGGSDLIFPHHENEIAQSEGCTGCHFVNYWLHNGFITINSEKMSKSLNNFFLVKDVLEKYSGDALRFFLLSTHYRSPLDFSDDRLEEAEKNMDKLKDVIARIKEMSSMEGSEETEASRKLAEAADHAMKVFHEAMDDDFNTADAVSAIYELVRFSNTEIKAGASKEFAEKIQDMLDHLCGVLGVAEVAEEEVSDEDVAKIEALIAERTEAKKAKDFAKADAIRDELAAMGITIKDTRQGVQWFRG